MRPLSLILTVFLTSALLCLSCSYTGGYRDVRTGGETRPSTKDADSRPSRQGPSGLRAGYADDNKQFNYFINFLSKYDRQTTHYNLPIQERIILRLRDSEGHSIPNASVSVFSGDKKLEEGRTFADGSYFLYPALVDPAGAPDSEYKIKFTAAQRSREFRVRRGGPRHMDFTWDSKRALPESVPVDIVFIFDTTGSMGEEIKRLKQSIEIIHQNVSAIRPRPNLRFGMVLYRDRGDDYRTKIVPLTSDLNAFQKELDQVEAGGGGDHPEDLQAALADAMQKMEWNREGLRMAFVITDAPPHLDYDQEYRYTDAASDARKNATKIFTIGTGGLNLDGEYILRQLAQFTYGRYIFLTYGERGESEGGRVGSVSHHTGSNFKTDRLESIIIRFAREEIAHVSKITRVRDEEYFVVKKVSAESNEETLQKLFQKSVDQLLDYSSLRVEKGTPTAVLPIQIGAEVAGGAGGAGSKKLATTPDAELTQAARFFTEQLQVSVSRGGHFQLVERGDLKKILGELELQGSGITNQDGATELGKFTNAKLLIIGHLNRTSGGQGTGLSLFLKLVRVETAEVLSVTRATLAPEFGRVLAPPTSQK